MTPKREYIIRRIRSCVVVEDNPWTDAWREWLYCKACAERKDTRDGEYADERALNPDNAGGGHSRDERLFR